MNLKLEILLLFLGGLIRIIVFAADIYYLIIISYKGTYTYYIAFTSLFAPSIVQFFVYIYLVISDLINHRFSMLKLLVALLFVLGDSLGINYFVFSIILCSNTVTDGDFYIVEVLIKSSALINSLFQSMPQIIVQIYNNHIMRNWTIFNIFSVGATCSSMIYTIFKLSYAVDKVKQYEVAAEVDKGKAPEVDTVNTAASRNSKARAVKCTMMNIIVPTEENNEDDEVYNSNI
ncbi:hypothetical protein SteCoe_11151 [Stentor coeruleus]|uniref:Uncharacterized protein n=1 Tax=Stentor coeruleus TaxID=5963 RepID=A0A1R2CDS6_9CILI|nr:hypothetical protein SteCoe_11151 [Stentor coeruleus]